MSVIRSGVAIVFIAAAYALLMFAAVDLPPKYEASLCIVMVLTGLAVTAFVPERQ